MPRSESTMATSGPLAKPAARSASIAERSSSGRPAMTSITCPSPSRGLAPAASSTAPCCSNRSAKNTSTAWPNMIGSDTFIIVALRCNENSTPCALASAICSARNVRSAATFITVESMTSPAITGTFSLSTVTASSAATNSMRTAPSSVTVSDCSFDWKSPPSIVATWVLESDDHAPIEWGCFLAYSLTACGARRSELPWRSTGLTAEPITAPYRDRISAASGEEPSSG